MAIASKTSSSATSAACLSSIEIWGPTSSRDTPQASTSRPAAWTPKSPFTDVSAPVHSSWTSTATAISTSYRAPTIPASSTSSAAQGQGRFAAREVINDKSGKPILRVPDQQEPVESFGSWLTLVDWDADGDLDILVGTYDGSMFVRRNEGSRNAAGLRHDRTTGSTSARPAAPGPRQCHANPVIVDWDGDGRWDIVTGSADGGVYCYRNTGQSGKPRFDAAGRPARPIARAAATARSSKPARSPSPASARRLP